MKKRNSNAQVGVLGWALRDGKRRRRRGTSVLEAVLVLPIILASMFLMAEWGYFFYVMNTLEGAAREGARAAIVPKATLAEAQSAVASWMSHTNIPDGKYTVEFTPAAEADWTGGTLIVVKVQCAWTGDNAVGLNLLPNIGLTPKGSVKGTAVMRRETDF